MPDTPNGRVTIAVLGSKLDSLIAAQLQTNAKVEEIRRTQNDMRQDLAVNHERWENHQDLHTRERGILGTLSAIFSAIAAAVAVWIKS